MDNEKKNTSSNHTIELSKRYVGPIAAGLVITLQLSFMTGYFWGKKKAFEIFCKSTEQDSLADQIFVALCGVSEYKETPGSPAATDIDEVVDEQESAVQQAPDNTIPVENVDTSDVVVAAVPGDIVADIDSPKDVAEVQHILEEHHAELIGFGTLQGAKRFASRLEKKHIDVCINKRVSKTARGRVVTWYQVVTKTYTNKDDLVALVNSIKQQERLNDVRIVSNS